MTFSTYCESMVNMKRTAKAEKARLITAIRRCVAIIAQHRADDSMMNFDTQQLNSEVKAK